MTTWVKVFNSMPGHGKFLLAGDRASWLFVCGLCYSNEHLTNGFVARHALPGVAPGVKTPEALAQRLVDADLWHEVEGGWTIHDYVEHQRSADEIRERRDRDRERKSNGRRAESNGSPRGQVADSARNPGGVQADSRAHDRACSQEVEGREQKAEGRDNTNAELRSAVVECFAYWQEKCGHRQAQLDAKRRRNIEGRLKDRKRHHSGDRERAISDVRQAIDGAAIGAYVDDRGKRHDDIELICRNVTKLEDFMARASAPVVSIRDGMSELDRKRLASANRLMGGGAA